MTWREASKNAANSNGENKVKHSELTSKAANWNAISLSSMQSSRKAQTAAMPTKPKYPPFHADL